MNTAACLAIGNPLAAALLLLCLATPGWGAETSEKNQPIQEDFGYDVVDGATNRIVRVSNITAASVFAVYEGGNSGRKILRQDLPPQLKAKYPYDASRVAESQKQQAALAAQQAVAQRLVASEVLGRREEQILAEISVLARRDTEYQKKKNILYGLPPGNGRRIRAAHINDDQQIIRERILQLRSVLQQVRAQRDNAP